MDTPELDAHAEDDADLPFEVVETVPTTAMVRVEPSGVPTVHARSPFDPDALPRPLDPRLVLLADPNGPRAASFRVLRDRLVAAGLPRIAAVSSALPGEGKTTCAANLALAFAEQPRGRVLLVEGNIFAPELGALFGVHPSSWGGERPAPTSSWGGEGAPWTLVRVMPSLHVCVVPWRPGEPVPRMDPHRFEAMFAQLGRASYDTILLDTPAVRGTPGTLPILGVAGGTLFVVRAGKTTGREVLRAAEQIPNKGLGIVLMDGDAAD